MGERAHIVYGAALDRVEPGAPRVCVHGALDDHLRVSTLLARWAQEQCPERVDRDAVAQCLSAGTPFDARLAALEGVLASVEGGLRVVMVDFEALYVAPPEPRPDAPESADATFRRARRALFGVLARAAERNPWCLARPHRWSALGWEGERWRGDEAVEDALASFPSEEAQEPSALGALSSEVSPATARILEGLVRLGWRSEADVRGLVMACVGSYSEDALLGVAFDALPDATRDAACRLALARGAHRRNGAFGGVAWSEGDAQPRGAQARRGEVEALMQAGWLVPVAPGRWMMHAYPRRFLAARGRWLVPDYVATHSQLAQAPRDDSLDAQLEQHHHAIEADDVDLARATARYYGADLRAVAYRLSRQGRYGDAARLYAHIVETYDARDAYAWEYLAYNLDRAGGEGSGVEGEVEAAYRKAVELEPHNALYQGRLLGWRAAHGLARSARAGA